MKHGSFESPWRVPWLLAVLMLLAAPLSAARPAPKTLAAFEDYLREKEKRLERRLTGEQSFLWALESAERERGLRRGEIYVKPRSGKGEVDIHRGLVHDWVGAVFIPGVTLEETLSTIQDYDNLKRFYSGEVTDSKLLEQKGDDYRVFLRLQKHKIITVVLNTQHMVRYHRLDSGRAYSRSYSTVIREVSRPGKPNEAELPVGEDHGFLQRLHSYWRFQETPQGVYVEGDVVGLTRGVPFGLGWLIKPIIRSLPRHSLEITLRATREAVLSRNSTRRVTETPGPTVCLVHAE